jgi:16S rRNA (guanine527-N7)-methyltransferase
MSRSAALAQYKSLVQRYHETLDLVSDKALASLDQMIAEAEMYGQLVASLSPAPRSIVDLGSGVGLPGLPMALALPDRLITLVERRRRRASFLRIAVSQLGLSNVTVFAGDVRSMTEPCVDVVTAQAVGSLADVYELTRRLQGERVWLVSRKGPRWVEELSELEAGLRSAAIDRREEELSARGTLVAVLLPGGSACPQSG